jgi:hypothetical protein
VQRSQPGSFSWQQTPPSHPGSSFFQQPPPSEPGGSSWHHQMDLGNTTLYLLLNIVGSQINFTYFTLSQSAASRSCSCIQSSHRCLVVLVRS